MGEQARVEVRIQAMPVDVTAEIKALSHGGKSGAIVTFTGICRDEAGRIEALELEHYPGMAEREIKRICEEAVERWPLLGCRAIHRHGLVRPGETIVFVGCVSAHRHAAFDGASFVMDFLKSRAPFWKREHLIGGKAGDWVSAKDTDEAALARWDRS